jgi:hypothetical protein
MKASSIQVLSTPRTGSSAFGKLLVESGFNHVPPFDSIEDSSASEFNKNGYFENAELSLCLDNLIRFAFNDRNSFIFNAGMTPNKKDMRQKLQARLLLEYDLDENSVVIPADYVSNVKKYTGHDWDVWGLTRMHPGMKWHLAYSRVEVQTPEKAQRKLDKYFSYLSENDFVFIKDPRLIYLLPIIDIPIRAVVIKRNPKEILRSMRNHYGPNLFTEKVLHDDWVSNHFNYRIQFQTFDEYLSIYQSFEKYTSENFDTNFIEYEKMYDLSELDRLSGNLGLPLAWNKLG